MWLLIFSLLYSEAANWCSSQEIGILICSFTLLPSILYLMGMEMFSHFTVVKLIHVSHFFRQGYDGIGKQAAAFILAISGLCISVRCRRAVKREAGNETPEDNDSQKQNAGG